MTEHEPYAYVAKWTRKRSTQRLEADLNAALRVECECDSYHGFTCGIHRRREELRWALQARRADGRRGSEDGYRS